MEQMGHNYKLMEADVIVRESDDNFGSLFDKKMESEKYDCVFTFNYSSIISNCVEKYNIPYISFVYDSPMYCLFTKSIYNKCNYCFIFDGQLCEQLINMGASHIYYMPLPVNVSRLDKMDTLLKMEDEDVKELVKLCSAQIAFVGSMYNEKESQKQYDELNLTPYLRGYLDAIMAAQIKVYGYNFIADCIDDNFIQTFLKYNPQIYNTSTGFKPDYKNIIALQYISVKAAEQERIRTLKYMSDLFNVDIYTRSDTSHMPNANNKGFAKSHEEMPLIFNQSKINLNITAKSIRSGLSQRIFDVLASGGFLITNYQSEIPEIFEDGKDLVMYSDMNQLKDLCSYYLEHEEERVSIAQNGFNKVKELHNYDIRMFQIIEKAFGQSE